MNDRKTKSEIITFKADPSLMDVLKRIPNRSAFIRTAVLSALENVCPLCQGTGILTPDQKNHWREFAADHVLETCGECNEVHLVCHKSTPRGVRRNRSNRS